MTASASKRRTQVIKKRVYLPTHPNARKSGHVLEHRLIAEKAFGKILPKFVQVHHFTDTQLVICEGERYHKLLHTRQHAYEATGNPNKRRCTICGQWENPDHLIISGRNHFHKICRSNYDKKRGHPNRKRVDGQPSRASYSD